MTDYKPGDRVRVTFEADVSDVIGDYLQFFDPDGDEMEIDHTGDWKSWTIEKLTPDYKAQIEALEPGTAFVLTTGPIENTYFRTTGGLITKLGSLISIEYTLSVHGRVDAIRILK